MMNGVIINAIVWHCRARGRYVCVGVMKDAASVGGRAPLRGTRHAWAVCDEMVLGCRWMYICFYLFSYDYYYH